MASSSSTKMMAGAAARVCATRSRPRLAPTPTIISTNSLAPMLKKGTLASPATARANNVLPVPGGPTSRTPLHGSAETGAHVGLFEKIDDFYQLLLGFVDPSHVGEGDARNA